MFTDAEFETACEEIDNPYLNGWEFFTQSYSGLINIYRQHCEESGLYAYKIFGTMDVPAETCAKVYIDTNYRKLWDPYIREIREVKYGDRTGIYWLGSYPFPLAKRDVVFMRETRTLKSNGRSISITLSKSDNVLSSLELVPKGVVRVPQFQQTIAITSHGVNSAKAFSYYYEDPGGLIPSWIINWAAKTGIPALLSNIEKGCREYDEYMKLDRVESQSFIKSPQFL